MGVPVVRMPSLRKDDVALFYREAPGSAPAVVLVHGWCCDHTYLVPHMQYGQAVGSGHFCQLEVPDQINAMIDRFLAIALADNVPRI